MSARKKQRVGENSWRGLSEPQALSAVQTAWNASTRVPSPSPSLLALDVEIIPRPFPVCIVRHAVPIATIKAALLEVPLINFFEKSNDLYQFKQTTDVANMKDVPAITELYNMFKNEIRSWVQDALCGSVTLKPEISATFSLYEYGDRLLCHDDKCEDRHIAFVLYLTEEWTQSLGGTLNLYSLDANDDPDKIVRQINPEFNSLVLFQVTRASFHEVAEVLTKSKKRLSLNGWFNCDRCTWPEQHVPKSLPILVTVPPAVTEINLGDFFLINYLKFRNQLDIKAMFVANSEIQLDEFFVQGVWDSICEETNSGLTWTRVGPANIRKYDVAEPNSLGLFLTGIMDMLQSRSWMRFLKNITGLDMVPSATSDTRAWNQGRLPSCRVELQRWEKGSYTLIHDSDPEFHTPGMDVFLRIPCDGAEAPPSNDQEITEPGHVIYIDKMAQDEECLLHLGHKMNSLGLIYRDLQTLRFTKYMDRTSMPFYQFQCLYIPWAPPVDNPTLKHVDSGSENEADPSGPEDFGDLTDSEGEDVSAYLEEGEEEEEEHNGEEDEVGDT